MDPILALKIIIMGIVEGLTEFLPISSTGHLILAGSLLDFSGEKAKVFEIAIQPGAILAVCWEYRKKIATVFTSLADDPISRRLAINVTIGFIPAAALGYFFSKNIKAHLFAPVPVALAFIIGGIIILIVEKRQTSQPSSVRIESVEEMSNLDAIKVGLAQSFGLIPGTSRSGATIIGAMLFGMSRKAATEFSFFLAIPTLIGATVYSLYKARDLLTLADVPMFGLGTLTAFVSGFFCVRWLLRYISTHTFTVFAWYRIAFGIMIILTWQMGWISWTE